VISLKLWGILIGAYASRLKEGTTVEYACLPDRKLVIRLATCLLCSVLFGCTVVGPNALRSGRLAYNEAITETSNQQMLMALVHNRYAEANTLLAVASVTANVSVSSSAEIQAGFGNSETYDGNLVPFSGGFVYEENPTISYIPVNGGPYLQQVMSPIPVSVFAQITHTMPYPEYAYDMLLSSVNGIRSPAFLFGAQQDDPRFARFVELMTELTHQHSLYWSMDSRNEKSISLVLEPSTEQSGELTDELLGMLNIAAPAAQHGRYVIPVSLALTGTESGGIGITTRTIHELVEILSAAVDVPTGDAQSGVAAPVPRPGRPGRDLKVHYSTERPEQAYVAVEYRDGWFYIHSQDQATKRYFKLMGNLWSSAMAQTLGTGTSAPVLTVPVSR
jgi:hypothetical protein